MPEMFGNVLQSDGIFFAHNALPLRYRRTEAIQGRREGMEETHGRLLRDEANFGPRFTTDQLSRDARVTSAPPPPPPNPTTSSLHLRSIISVAIQNHGMYG